MRSQLHPAIPARQKKKNKNNMFFPELLVLSSKKVSVVSTLETKS